MTGSFSMYVCTWSYYSCCCKTASSKVSLSLDGGSLLGFVSLLQAFSIQRVLPSGSHHTLSGLQTHFPSVPWYCLWREGFPKGPTEYPLFVACLCVLAEDVTELLVAASGHCCSWSWAQGTSHNLA